jgi:hypothetical protein
VVGAPALPRFVKEEDGGWMVDQHPEASLESQQQLRAMLREQKAAFAYSAAELTGYAGEHPPFRLDLSSEEPIRTPRRLLAPLAKAVADEKCGELLDAGFIESVRGPSIPYVSAVTIAAKKDSQGEWTEKRFCIDYRAVNAKTPLDHYPMQRAEVLYDRVGGAKVMSKLDLRAGFHQLPIVPDHWARTAFWWGDRVYQYLRLPFGLKNAPAYFQRVMDFELDKASCSAFAMAFVDDLLIFSNSTWRNMSAMCAAFCSACRHAGSRPTRISPCLARIAWSTWGTTCPPMASRPVPARCTPFWPCLPPSQ